MPGPIEQDRRLFSLLAGDARLPVRRVVPGEPEAMQKRLETVLEEKGGMRPLRRRPGRSVWAPSSNVFDRMQRSLGLDGRSYTLAKARHVDLAVAELEPGWTLITDTADLAGHRTGRASRPRGQGLTLSTLGCGASRSAGRRWSVYSLLPDLVE